jgi:hypothetical protein
MELPKIYRKAAGKIIMNGGLGLSNQSSMQTEQLRKRNETR